MPALSASAADIAAEPDGNSNDVAPSLPRRQLFEDTWDETVGCNSGTPPSLFPGHYRSRPPSTPCPHTYFNASPESSAQGRFETDFQIVGHPLGKGSFGTVHKCLSKVDGCTYAIKIGRRIKGKADRERMLKEVRALAALSNQADAAAIHVVRYHQAWVEEDRLHIVTELCMSTLQAELGVAPSEADLAHQRQVKAPPLRQPMSPERRYKLLREILLALELIHKNNMCHLDIKPENIFINADQYKLGVSVQLREFPFAVPPLMPNDSLFTVQLTLHPNINIPFPCPQDFGLVSKTSTSDEVEEGDSRYMPMELLSFGEHEDLTKSDIFSLGATMYEVCLGRPLPGDGDEWQNIRQGKLQLLPDTPPPMQAIITEMLHPDPKKRPDATILLARRELLSAEQKKLLVEQNKVSKLREQMTQPPRFPEESRNP